MKPRIPNPELGSTEYTEGENPEWVRTFFSFRVFRVFRGLTSGGLPRLLAAAGRVAGVACLAIAALSHWFLVPGAIEPGVTWIFRGLCVAAVVTTRFTRRGALLLALLLYPSAILHTSPGVAAGAAWLWHQHDQLTGYAGDIFTSQEMRDATWQQRIVVCDTPIPNRIIPLPVWSAGSFEWSRFFEIADWLGFSAWFSQCLARGWVLAMAGAALLFLTAPSFGSRSIARCLVAASVVFALATLPFFLCGHLLARARDLSQRGHLTEALTTLDRAARVLPAIGEDGAFFLQRGALENALHFTTPAAELFRARQLEEDGDRQQAQAAMLAALRVAEPGGVRQRELVRSLLADAIDALNSGQTHSAIASLESVLNADPCNLKANYALQIACVRAGRLEALRPLAARMRETYRFLNTPMKRSVLAAAHEHLAFAELENGASAAALAEWRNSKRLPR